MKKQTNDQQGERRILGFTILQFMSMLALAGIALTVLVNHYF